MDRVTSSTFGAALLSSETTHMSVLPAMLNL